MTIPDVEPQSWTPEEEVGVHRFTREEYEQIYGRGADPSQGKGKNDGEELYLDFVRSRHPG